MMKLNSEFRTLAREALRKKWGKAAVATLIYFLLCGAIGMVPYLNNLLIFFVGMPLGWGLMVLFLDIYRGSDVQYEVLLDGFKDYVRIFITTLLTSIYTVLWGLLLIIPGIIKGYSYALTPFILRDDAEIKNNEAIEKSMAMMEGNKMKLFLLDLSFIGWILLSFLTLGIGFLFVYPYWYTARAAFYDDLKKEIEKSAE